MSKLKDFTLKCKENFIMVDRLNSQREIIFEGKFLHWNRLVEKKKKKVPEGTSCTDLHLTQSISVFVAWYKWDLK